MRKINYGKDMDKSGAVAQTFNLSTWEADAVKAL